MNYQVSKNVRVEKVGLIFMIKKSTIKSKTKFNLLIFCIVLEFGLLLS